MVHFEVFSGLALSVKHPVEMVNGTKGPYRFPPWIKPERPSANELFCPSREECLLLGGFLRVVRAGDDDVFSVRAAGYGGTCLRLGRFQDE